MLSVCWVMGFFAVSSTPMAFSIAGTSHIDIECSIGNLESHGTGFQFNSKLT